MTGGKKNILTIAGSDSGGGAGIQADLKTMAALGAYGMSVITALTAQNGLGVRAIHAPEPEFALAQLDAVLEGFPVDAAKTGMLFSADIINAIAGRLQQKTFPLVVDPVAVSQSGHPLLQEDAVDALRKRMLPLADLLTPNLPEAELFSGLPLSGPADIPGVLECLLKLGPKAVLLKGGHFPEQQDDPELVVDWLGLPGEPPLRLEQRRIRTDHTHGTGCTLSAAIATGLGQGMDLVQAVRRAQEFLHKGLEYGFAPGKGFGPPDHMAWVLIK